MLPHHESKPLPASKPRWPEPDTTPRTAFPTIGILGGGQLGRMLAAAALRLGLKVRIFQDSDSGPASAATDVVTAPWDDWEALRRFASGCDVITLESEWAPVEVIERVRTEGTRVWPNSWTMERVRNKIRQKAHARANGIPVGTYRACANEAELVEAAETLGFPLVVKQPTHAYDGYGNRTVRDRGELFEVFAAGGGAPVLVEAWVPFVRELAVIVARRPSGSSVSYPVAVTIQRDHRCEAVEVPAPIPAARREAATALAERVAGVFGCVGVVGVELFELADGTLLLNELAPRPHNTGHFSIDACVTSQFENHLRAILDLPLGDTALLRPSAVMVNVLGRRHGASSADALGRALAVPGAAVHIYDKREVRPGRKMGHVTALADDPRQARALAEEAARRLEL